MGNARKQYHEALSKIDGEIHKMGVVVGESIGSAMRALAEHDLELANRVIVQDEKINQFEMDIQDRLTILIATEQPVAGELRHIITSLKITSQLERMGDHAVHIAKAVVRMKTPCVSSTLGELYAMADLGISMLQESLEAFTGNDQGKARAVASLDDKIDGLHGQVCRVLVNTITEDAAMVDQAISLLFVSRWLERFGDHVTNICEWIVYNSTGKHVELNL